MKRMLGLERPLKMVQSASDLDQILLRRGRTDPNLWRPILLKFNFYHGLVDHSTWHLCYMPPPLGGVSPPPGTHYPILYPITDTRAVFIVSLVGAMLMNIHVGL